MQVHDDIAAGRIRVDTFRASGPGGQHRNKTESAVRLTHHATGTQVSATESRSQHQNRATAIARMAAAIQGAASTEAHQQQNLCRQQTFTGVASFSWTGWRDQVRRSDGKTASMARALAGQLGVLLER